VRKFEPNDELVVNLVNRLRGRFSGLLFQFGYIDNSYFNPSQVAFFCQTLLEPHRTKEKLKTVLPRL
jgi:hypothetical protein